jgi:hypothetical protein
MSGGTVPWVVQSPERIARIKERASVVLAARAEALWREMILQWAVVDEGRLPTRADAERIAQNELEVLCRGLGRWSALEPREVFPEREWWE